MSLSENFERIHELSVGEDYDFSKVNFDKIPENERLHPNRRICGFLKVYSLLKGKEEFDVCAEHDMIYLCPEDNLIELTDEDILYLIRCGIGYDMDTDSLSMFC